MHYAQMLYSQSTVCNVLCQMHYDAMYHVQMHCSLRHLEASHWMETRIVDQRADVIGSTVWYSYI